MSFWDLISKWITKVWNWLTKAKTMLVGGILSAFAALSKVIPDFFRMLYQMGLDALYGLFETLGLPDAALSFHDFWNGLPMVAVRLLSRVWFFLDLGILIAAFLISFALSAVPFVFKR